MMKALLKYRLILVFGVLFIYTSTTFQKPLLEVMHFAAHGFDFTDENFEWHNYSSHSADHQHSVLENLSSEDKQNTPYTTIVNIDKVFDHLVSAPATYTVYLPQKLRQHFKDIPLVPIFKTILTPPPQLL